MKKHTVCYLLFVLALSPAFAWGQTKEANEAKLQEKLNQTASKGVEFLLEKGRDQTDGSFSKQLSPAVTALCVSALVRNGVPVGNAKVQQSLTFIESMVRPDGGIYAKDSHLRNYETSVSLIALNQCNVDGKYDETLDRAAKFLKGIQWDAGEGHGIESNHHGGQGYGSHKRPDLSNTSFFIDALKELEKEGMANSSAVRKLSTTPAGGLRGYASMTYAGLKTFLYAGLDKDDFRVKAAMDWIRTHYDLDNNPGMGKQGLFYYYHVFAKTMLAVGDPMLTDLEGVDHNWRDDLVTKLASLQSPDGSWTNEHDRWYEGDPNLVTAYSLLAISYCRDLPTNEETETSK